VELRLVDLSLPIYDRMPTYPVMPKTAITPHIGEQDLPFNLHQLVLCSHLGTHLDAPYHFLSDGLTVDKLDLRKCVGPAAVVDLSGKGPKEEIRPEDLYPYEEAIASCRRIILRTGWDKRFASDGYFSDHPAVTREACVWMLERRIVCLALDMPSTHVSEDAETHRLLLGPDAEVVLIEGLRGLDRLRGAQVVLMALPLAIEGCDGSPCRVVAIDGDVASLGASLNALALEDENSDLRGAT